MAYHITLFKNNSNNSVLTANAGNPTAKRDTYFISPGQSKVPDNGNYPHIEERGKGKTPSPTSYNEAFKSVNFIYTVNYAYCFWDEADDRIVGITAQDPTDVKELYTGGASNLVLIVDGNGKISFQKS
jgi:hypothetical protein